MPRVILPQDAPGGATSTDLVQQLQTLGWVDHTALAVLLVFFVIGLFKGLIWQVSRIAILVAAYVVAGRYGTDIADVLASPSADPAAAPPSETTIYLAYVLLFLGVLIVLSLLAILLQKLAAKAGLGFFDRLGGGVLGVATGACVVLFGLFVVHMFFRGSGLAVAAESSHSLRLGKRAIDWLGDKVPDEMRSVFALAPLRAAAAGDGTSLPPLPNDRGAANATTPTVPGNLAPAPRERQNR
jgi:membrane protein required for colicin V production